MQVRLQETQDIDWILEMLEKFPLSFMIFCLREIEGDRQDLHIDCAPSGIHDAYSSSFSSPLSSSSSSCIPPLIDG